MSVRFDFDVHVRRAVTRGLRLRDVDVLTSQEDGTIEFADPDLLDRATSLRRVLFTQDDDFLREAARRQETSEFFAGIIYAHQLNITVGQCVDDLEFIAKASGPVEWANKLAYLPL
jgi:hypothetical protein